MCSVVLKPSCYLVANHPCTVELGLFDRGLARVVLIVGIQVHTFHTKLDHFKLGALDGAHARSVSADCARLKKVTLVSMLQLL